jgi:hypothetical protein
MHTRNDWSWVIHLQKDSGLPFRFPSTYLSDHPDINFKVRKQLAIGFWSLSLRGRQWTNGRSIRCEARPPFMREMQEWSRHDKISVHCSTFRKNPCLANQISSEMVVLLSAWRAEVFTFSHLCMAGWGRSISAVRQTKPSWRSTWSICIEMLVMTAHALHFQPHKQSDGKVGKHYMFLISFSSRDRWADTPFIISRFAKTTKNCVRSVSNPQLVPHILTCVNILPRTPFANRARISPIQVALPPGQHSEMWDKHFSRSSSFQSLLIKNQSENGQKVKDQRLWELIAVC